MGAGPDLSEAVDAGMRARIRAELDRIEAEEDVTILFAIESGSRAWGFHSRDSDYDVRFVYTRRPDWFLGLQERRDVIERPISDLLDISGWELGKALKLAMKSNAVLWEWLQSPIHYADKPAARQRLAEFCQKALTRRAVTWHYLSIATQQADRMASPQGIRLKRYFYLLRPVMTLRWMRLHQSGMPPMNLWQLIEQSDIPPGIVAYLRNLVAIKLETGEMGTAAASDPAADALIAEELAHAREWLAQGPQIAETSLMDTANRLHLDLTKGLW